MPSKIYIFPKGGSASSMELLDWRVGGLLGQKWEKGTGRWKIYPFGGVVALELKKSNLFCLTRIQAFRCTPPSHVDVQRHTHMCITSWGIFLQL